MKKSIKKLVFMLLVLLTAAGLTACDFSDKSRSEIKGKKQFTLDAEQEINAQIQTEELKNRLIMLKVTIPAQFKAMQKRLDRIYAPIDGRVIGVYVEPGTFVKKGQSLIEIKSDSIGQIQLEFLDKYISVDLMSKQMAAQYNLSTQTYKREAILFREGISSRAEYEMARAQMLKDRANVDSLRVQKNAIIKVYGQRVALYGGSASTINRAIVTKRIYPYITLHANKTGVVLERMVNPGEIINQNRELFNIADLSTIWLVGYAFEKDAPHIFVGQNVVGLFERDRSKVVKGKLSYVASMLDTDKKTLEVIADIPNKDYLIKPNMYAEMVVDLGEVSALAVPNTALQKYGDYTFAYVKVAPNIYEERKVEIGQKNNQYSEVKSGLKVGEMVVTHGGFSLLGESIKNTEE